jgi:cob(I)alamin adenosyltransferase
VFGWPNQSELVVLLSEDGGDTDHVANKLKTNTSCGEHWRVEVEMDGCIDVWLNAVDERREWWFVGVEEAQSKIHCAKVECWRFERQDAVAVAKSSK